MLNAKINLGKIRMRGWSSRPGAGIRAVRTAIVRYPIPIAQYAN